MKNEFIHNACIMEGRKDVLYVEQLLIDLGNVFEKHGIESVGKGFIGFKDGKFCIVNCDIKSINYGVEIYKFIEL